jgi:hypothetical protein
MSLAVSLGLCKCYSETLSLLPRPTKTKYRVLNRYLDKHNYRSSRQHLIFVELTAKKSGDLTLLANCQSLLVSTSSLSKPPVAWYQSNNLSTQYLLVVLASDALVAY